MKYRNKLKTLRTQREFTQEDLAEKLSVSKNDICDWEDGICIPSEEKIAEIEQLFSEEEIFEKETPPQKVDLFTIAIIVFGIAVAIYFLMDILK